MSAVEKMYFRGGSCSPTTTQDQQEEKQQLSGRKRRELSERERERDTYEEKNNERLEPTKIWEKNRYSLTLGLHLQLPPEE